MLGSLFSSGSSAARQAARAERKGMQQAIAEQRRQFDETRNMLMPFVDAGTGQLDSLTQGAGLEGFAGNLNEILMSEAFDPIRQRRQEAINANFGQAGLLNSSGRARAIADDLTDFGMGIEGMLFDRQGGLAGMGQNAAGSLAGFGQQTAQNIGNLQAGMGQSRAAGILSSQQARSNALNQGLGMLGGIGGGALMGQAGMLGSLGAAGGAGLGLLMSDSRLKTNITPVGEVGPLTVYQWDWIPELKELGIEIDMTTGFLAEDVESVYPEHVHPVGKFKAVDYRSVLDRIEKELH